jgi:tetratricopeptide (TPR) repeat protein
MDERIKQFIDILDRFDWPGETGITDKAIEAFEQADRIFDLFRGDPRLLLDAVMVCLQGNCRPYAFAAAAKAIISCSYQVADNYDNDGLSEALRWLERAQHLAPDRNEINIIEVDIYLRMKRLRDARVVLDHITRIEPGLREIPKAEMQYAHLSDNHARWEIWAQRALENARDAHDRFILHNTFAGHYLMYGLDAQCIDAYKIVVQITPNDPWAWHNMSIAYMNIKSYKEAHECNVNALRIMDFGAARRIEKQLKQKKTFFGWRKN